MRLLVLLILTLLLAVPVAAQRTPFPAGTVEIAYGNDARQRLDFTPAASPGPPLVLFVHGGAWSMGDMAMAGHMAAHFHDRGYAFASVDYRLVPDANPQLQAEDVAAALARLLAEAPRLGIDRGRVMLIGHSAGAHLAALVGTDPAYLAAHRLPIATISGVVLLDGAGYDVAAQLRYGGPLIRSLYHRAFGDDPAFHARVSPIAQAAAPNAGRFLIFHISSRADSAMQSARLGALLRAAGTPAEVVSVDGTHAEIFRNFGQPGHPATARTDAFAEALFAH
ncbi:MAG: alpha/beta hydrolase [Sphingomonadaceae bacterium]|nr:alpha/beta hydrolase [Sphingomonadaceae bacterium]